MACVATVLYLLALGKFSWPEQREKIIFFLGFFAILVWHQFQNAMWANFIVCIAYFLSFYPTISGVLKGKKESPWSWWFCTFAYIIATIDVAIKNCDGAVIAPAILALLHAGVAIASIKKSIAKK